MPRDGQLWSNKNFSLPPKAKSTRNLQTLLNEITRKHIFSVCVCCVLPRTPLCPPNSLDILCQQLFCFVLCFVRPSSHSIFIQLIFEQRRSKTKTHALPEPESKETKRKKKFLFGKLNRDLMDGTGKFVTNFHFV